MGKAFFRTAGKASTLTTQGGEGAPVAAASMIDENGPSLEASQEIEI